MKSWVLPVVLLSLAAVWLAGCATSTHVRMQGFDQKRAKGSTVVLVPMRSVEIAVPQAFDRLWGTERRVPDGGAAFLSQVFAQSFRHVFETGKLVYDSSLTGDSLFLDTVITLQRDTTALSRRKDFDAGRHALYPVAGGPLVTDSIRQSSLRRNALEAAGHAPDLAIVITRLFVDTVQHGYTVTYSGASNCYGDAIWIRLDYMVWDYVRGAPAALGRVDRVTSEVCGRINREKWLVAMDFAARDIIANTAFKGRKFDGNRDPMVEYYRWEKEMERYRSTDYLWPYMKLK